MTTPEKGPDPIDFQVEIITEDGEIIEVTDVVSDTTVRPLRESLRKHLKPPFNGQPFPPEVQAEIERMRALASGEEDDIITIDDSNSISDNTVRPARESIRKALSKYLQPPYTAQPLPPAGQQEPPKDNPPS